MSLPRFVLENAPELRQAVVRRNARESVADKIAQLIASGVLTVGGDLPSERHLASALQVSRETVRAGIAILQREGLVSVVHGARTRVVSDRIGSAFQRSADARPLAGHRLDDIHAARLLVERPVVADAARHVDADTIGFLRDSIAAQRAAIGDPVRFLITDREFHAAIYRSCANPVLADFVLDLFGTMMEFRRHAVAEPGAIELSIADHERIVAALERRDGAAAAEAIEIHLERIYRTTREVIGQSRELSATEQ